MFLTKFVFSGHLILKQGKKIGVSEQKWRGEKKDKTLPQKKMERQNNFIFFNK